MRTLVRAVSALLLLAVAAPALPCGEAKSAQASASVDQAKKQAVAKSDAKKAGVKSKVQAEKEKTAAAN